MNWKIVNLLQIIIATVLTLLAGFFFFTVGDVITILVGGICLSVAVIIQVNVGLNVYKRDIMLLSELKKYENLLEVTRDEMKDIPKSIESNNSNIDDVIRSNNLDICEYINQKILELKEFIKENKK